MAEVKKTKSVCFWCKAKCCVVVHHRDGILLRVTKDQNFPPEDIPAKRIVCPHREAAQEWFYNPNRLNYPLKRAGEKGEAKWQRISWDQALDEIAANLAGIKEKHGPESLAATNGDYWTHTEYCQRFLSLFGTPNHIGPSPICMGPRAIIPRAIMGWWPGFSITPETRCVVLYGVEAMVARPRLWEVLTLARENGAKVIAIDPRQTQSTAIADIWLKLRPGTDTFLMMAIINYIIQQNLYDREFVEKWCYGFDALRERAKKYTIETAEEVTWVPAQKIIDSARLYAETKPAVFIEGMGIEQQPTASTNMHCRCVLAAITGNLDIKGGEALTGPHPLYISDREIEMWDHLPDAQKTKQIGSDRFKLHTWPGQKEIHRCFKNVFGGEADHAIWYLGQAHAPSVYRAMLTGKPYPVRAMISQASNPLVSQANTKLVYKAIKSLDLYVVMDLFMTPSAVLADYVLPAASWLERPHIDSYLGYGTHLLAWPAAIPASMEGKYDRRTDFDFWRGLGMLLGQEQHWPWKSLEESYTYRLKNKGYTFEEFVEKKSFERDIIHQPRRYKSIGFATPTGKVELYSTIFEKLGYDPLPEYKEPDETPVGSPQLAIEYPLILTCSGRSDVYMHSDWRQVQWIRRLVPDPLVQIHPETASELGIEDKEWLWIETPRGRIRQRASLTDGIHPRVVAIDFDWWYPELPEEEPYLMGVWESNMNVLVDDDPDNCDPMLGSWPLRLALCKIYSVKDSLKQRKHLLAEKGRETF